MSISAIRITRVGKRPWLAGSETFERLAKRLRQRKPRKNS
jgi:hypothetical protein